LDIKDLKFVRLDKGHLWNMIPRRYIEQVKDRGWTTDRFFEIAPILLSNPMNVMGVFVDSENQIKGFLWVNINLLTEYLNVITLSIDREYQDTKGSIIDHVFELIKDMPNDILTKGILKSLKINLKEKIRMATKHPLAYERRKWRRSDLIIMEK
jgi:hypothetical protein